MGALRGQVGPLEPAEEETKVSLLYPYPGYGYVLQRNLQKVRVWY